MSYLPVEQGYAQDREVRRLGRLLGTFPMSPDAQAMGHLLAARLWSIDNCPRGTMPASDGWILEEAALWRGGEGILVDAFCEIGFLRREGDHLCFPDWSEHQGRVLDARRAAREKKQRQRSRERSKVPSTGESTGESTGDTPGESRSKGQDIDKDIDKRTGRPPQDESFSSDEEKKDKKRTDAIEEASRILEAFPPWNVGDISTRVLVTELVSTYPYIDIGRECLAWRDQVLEKGDPRDCKAALRGWMKKARMA